MIAVIFEVTPNKEGKEQYFATAAKLKRSLHQIDGFISVERFQNVENPEAYLSLSFWRDETAVSQWRNTIEHRHAQAKGRNSLFADYRLRVANVVRDYGLKERAQVPDDRRVHNK